MPCNDSINVLKYRAFRFFCSY